ncbi:MAG: hypothetical protein R2798_03400 [Chitinophagales bacterium]
MIKFFSLPFFMLIFFLSACTPNETAVKAKAKISAEEAKKLAETFVKEQAYTNRKTNLSFKDFKLEENEFASDKDGILKIRQNTLFDSAYGARMYLHQTRWAVGFEYTDDIPNICRWVSMDTLGNDIKMEPTDTNLEWFDMAKNN